MQNPKPKSEASQARRRQFVEDLRRALVDGTAGCNLQEGANGKAWPCGTCTCSLLGDLMAIDAPAYSLHNEPVDRVNEVWRAILQIRDLTE